MSIPRKKSVTAKDIARVCGISQATVSYVMNNKEGKKISEATRQLVLKTARELNYVPNSTARSMRTNRSMSIGVVSGRNNLTIGFSHILRGIKEYLDKAGYSITLLTDDGRERLKDSPEQHEYVRYYHSSRIDGILFLFYEMEDSVMKMLEEEHIPFFLVDESGVWCGSQQQHTLLEEGISQAVTLCREKQFLNLGFFSSQFGDTLFSRKWGLFSRLLAENHPQAQLHRCVFQVKDISVEALTAQILQNLECGQYDAVITPNPRMGWAVQSAILQKNFSLPLSTYHICLAASSIFQLVYPTITCLDMPLEEMGTYAARQILRRIAGQPVETHSFTCQLKESTSAYERT